MKHIPKILEYLENVNGLKNPDRSNTGKLIWEIFIWQEISSRSKKLLEKAWKIAQAQNLVADDEELRKLRGEHSVLSTKDFACMIKVDEPRSMFNKDKFIKKVAKKYKIKEEDLIKLSLTCCDPSKAVLSKRIAEIGDD